MLLCMQYNQLLNSNARGTNLRQKSYIIVFVHSLMVPFRIGFLFEPRLVIDPPFWTNDSS